MSKKMNSLKESESIQKSHSFCQDGIPTDTFTPHDYQVEMLDIALNKNIIVCLSTGTGKTFIGALLIKELSHELLGDFDENAKRTVFIVNTVPLVKQQAKVIRQHTNLTVGEYNGSMNVDYWDKGEWLKNFRTFQVLVMTCQIFLNILNHNFVELSKINLLIIDECHHAVKHHPFREIMRHFDKCSKDNYPRVLGLTASVLNGNINLLKLKSCISSLEKTLRSSVVTANEDIDMSKFGTKPNIYFIECREYYDSTGLISQMKTYLAKLEYFLGDYKNSCSQVKGASTNEDNENDDDYDFDGSNISKLSLQILRTILYVLQSLGPWCAIRMAGKFLSDLENICDRYSSEIEIKVFQMVQSSLRVLMTMYENYIEKTEDGLMHLVCPKMARLLNILKSFKPSSVPVSEIGDHDNENGSKLDETKSLDEDLRLCGIIFVERRYVAFLLHHFIKEYKRHNDEFSFINSNYIVGHGSFSSTPEAAMNYKKQESVLKSFRKRELNLIIATNVIEEGIDIPKCNLVVRFDLPKDYRSYVQSKGRARAANSKYIMLVPEKSRETFVSSLIQFISIENEILKKSYNHEPPDENSIDDHMNDQIIPPYVVEETGARVTMQSAISLVNRYCAKLPSDIFTRLVPKYSINKIESGQVAYQCCLTLPINSPVRNEIVGEYMPSKSLSRKAVAVKACTILHQEGELDNNLLPVGKESLIYEEEENEDEEIEPVTEDTPRPGTTKRRQHYDKKIADALTDCFPDENKPNYLYIITMRLTVPLPEEQNTRGRKIYPPENTSRCFGILTSKKIPKIPEFPVFTRSGEVAADLKLVTDSLTLDSRELKILEHFHNYVFSNVLQLKKQHMTYVPRQATSCYLIVPLNKDSKSTSEWTIDWEFADVIYPITSDKVMAPTEQQRQNFHFNKAKYEDAVVMPWYRHNDQPEQYYVAEICVNLNPVSQFPDGEFDTFESYYLSKYGKNIFNKKQPLLDVDRTSSRLNMLSSRHMNRKGKALPTSSDETKKAKREDLHQKQILVPELCEIHPFPASLWRKAVCLPSILYRTNSLLLAEELRVRVSIEMNIMQTVVPFDFDWPPLQASWSLIIEEEKTAKPSKIYTPSSFKPMPMSCIVSGLLVENSNFPIGSWDNSMVNEKKEMIFESDEDDDDDCEMEIGNWDNNFALGNGGNFSKYYSPLQSLDDDLDVSWCRNGNLGGHVEILSMNGVNCKGNGLSSSFQINQDDIDDFEEMSQFPFHSANMQNHDFRFGSPTYFQSAWEDNDALSWSDDSEADKTKKFHIPDVIEYIKTCSPNNSFEESTYSNRSSPLSLQEINEDDNDRVSPPLKNNVSPEKKQKYSIFFLLQKKPSPKKSKSSINEMFDDNLEDNFNIKDSDDEKNIVCYFEQVALISPEENIFFDKTPINNLSKVFLEINLHENILKHKEPSEINNSQSADEIQNYSSCNVDSDLPMNDKENSEFFNKLDLLSNEFKSKGIVENKKSLSQKKVKIKFDEQINLKCHLGPSPSTILQAFTMSNANDIFNLERLETIGDSFLKHAVTSYLYLKYVKMHEGKLSFLRSKQVSNLNLYRLGKKKGLGLCMAANKFEPSDNWLPPGYLVSKDLALQPEKMGSNLLSDYKPYIIPYNLLTQHSIPDKSIADCVEALIGAYLISCGSQGALLFMTWLGLKVLPKIPELKMHNADDNRNDYNFVCWELPPSPLLNIPSAIEKLNHFLQDFSGFEEKVNYCFKDKAYLLQAFTHPSYYYNKITDCYQRLEFLGDAILDYLITRYLYEDAHDRSPGELTDLRSALVNNTIFASLAVKFDFHKYFKYLSPSLFEIIKKFVTLQEERNNSINEEDVYGYFNSNDEDNEEAEDVEAPKALGDIFESVAGAIYLDSGMSLDAVWKVYFQMMHEQIEQFSTNVPKSPIRELLEMEPDTAKFGKPERKLNGKVRVTVEVIGKGKFVGVGRNYNIAKCTAAKRALKYLKAAKVHITN